MSLSLLNLPQRPVLSRSSSISSTATLRDELDGDSSRLVLSKEIDVTPTVDIQTCIELPLKPITGLLASILYAHTAESPRPLKLVGLLATRDKGCEIYAKMTAKHCVANGVEFDKRVLDGGAAGFEKVKSAILEINQEEGVDGLIVYFPLFGPVLDEQLRNLISPEIDVEGLSPCHLDSSYASAPARSDDLTGAIFPCTPLAVVRCLQALPLPLEGRIVTVVNRSETVGRPLAAMLANSGATVYSVDVESTLVYLPSTTGYTVRPCSSALSDLCSLSDVIVSAVPSDSFKIKTSDIKLGAVCVNVATGNNFEGNVRERAGVWIGKLGEVTRWTLLLNAVALRARRC